MAFLGWTYINAVVGMVFYSISLAFGPIAMITSIGMILPSDYIGTGLGIYKSSNNVGTSILDIVVGVVQDNTADQAYTGNFFIFLHAYFDRFLFLPTDDWCVWYFLSTSGVLTVYLVLACIGFVLICGLIAMQRIVLDNVLEVGRTKRQQKMKAANDEEIEKNKHGHDALEDKPIRPINVVFIGLFIAALIVAWVLFFVYAITGEASP